jgi:hypothetical protein
VARRPRVPRTDHAHSREGSHGQVDPADHAVLSNKDFDDRIYAGEPYSEDAGRDTFNDGDNLYVDEGELTLTMDGNAAIGLITLDVKRS